MCPAPTDDSRETAIERLEQFGLSAYAARTYVALVTLGEGTARDVGEVSDVPRTRVYDAVEELERRGLVDVQHAEPKRFRPVSPETTGRKFEGLYRHRAESLTEALDALGSAETRDEQRGVWTVTDRESITDRVVEFVDGAQEEVVFMTVADLLDEAVIASVERAADRGVSIRLGGLEPSVEETIRETVPDVETFDSLWVWSDTPAGRILLVDETKTLASVLVDDGTEETAIWGAGRNNSLVVVLRAMFTWRLDPDREV